MREGWVYQGLGSREARWIATRLAGFSKICPESGTELGFVNTLVPITIAGCSQMRREGIQTTATMRTSAGYPTIGKAGSAMEDHPPTDPVSYLVQAGGTPWLIDGLLEGLGDAEVAVVVGVEAVSGEVY